jgi:hypothetical protein
MALTAGIVEIAEKIENFFLCVPGVLGGNTRNWLCFDKEPDRITGFTGFEFPA